MHELDFHVDAESVRMRAVKSMSKVAFSNG